ncbi:holin [Arthrobacter phage Abba]|uniref:Holin n=1 Tax=Arthrobacter phage Abba TaxID=2713256 RepID=A0A6G8R2B4_9CAUD|nr:holin [Arthrobacter phage Abba]QIN94355.1 holin [Arthrobacter phage Abba]
MTISFWLVVALFVSLLGVIALYAVFTRWRATRAGLSLMTLLVSFGALVGFTLVARFFADRALMYSLYNALLVALIAAVWYVGGVMAVERFGRRR